MKKIYEFTNEDIKAFEPEAKVGLIATINKDYLPHITLITSIQAKHSTQLIWGQFSEGLSKKNVLSNPKTAFLIMTLDKKLWRGKSRWTHSVKEGPDYDMFNTKPMFRYNAYFGIHTVHYMELAETTGMENLPLMTIIPAILHTQITKFSKINLDSRQILTPWAKELFSRIDTLKFLAYIGYDGFPAIIPLIQCQAFNSVRLIFSPIAYYDEIKNIPENSKVAVFGLTYEMESVLVRGHLKRIDLLKLLPFYAVDIEWVYNSMPPIFGQIYP